MKKYYLLIALLLTCFALIHSETTAQPPSNFGEETAGKSFNPFLISSLANLRWLSETESVWGSSTNRVFFKQTADIDAAETKNWNNGQGFRSIGNPNNPFFGIYDGDNHCIFGIYINTIGQLYVGFFGFIQHATIKSLKLVDVNISSTSTGGIGGITGRTTNSFIFRCSVSGIINAVSVSDVGGLIGRSNSTDIYYSYSTVTINAENVTNVGGLLGFMWDYTFIDHAFFNGTINSSNSSLVGGVVGLISESQIRNVYVTTKQPLAEYSRGILPSADTWTMVIDTFWNVETTADSIGSGGVFFTSIVEVAGLTSDQMKDVNTYINGNSKGWDFVNTWFIDPDINNGYPYFKANISTKPSNFYELNAGTEENPFKISDLMNLKWLSESREFWRDQDEQVYFVQTQDIDATETALWNNGEGFIPIGLSRYLGNSKSFLGVYDGAGYKIENLTIKSRPQTFYDISAGLFGTVGVTTIKNLRLENANVMGSDYVGALVGKAYTSTIENCSVSGTVSGYRVIPQTSFHNRGSYSAGSLIGFASHQTHINMCYSNAFLLAEEASSSGGLIGGLAYRSTLNNSFFSGKIEFTPYSESSLAGGLVGFGSVMGDSRSNIHNSYVTSSESFVNIYGLVGNANRLNVSNTFWDAQTTGVTEAVGSTWAATLNNAVGYNTNEMKSIQTYTNSGWDFENIWFIDPDINNGYPYLRSMSDFVSDIEVSIIKINTRLLGNYPNPFNPETTIKFSLDKKTDIRIDVYNIRGQRVKTLLNSFMDKGEHSVLWNGTDDNGLSVSSGVYFYRMMTDDFNQTKRMLLLK